MIIFLTKCSVHHTDIIDIAYLLIATSDPKKYMVANLNFQLWLSAERVSVKYGIWDRWLSEQYSRKTASHCYRNKTLETYIEYQVTMHPHFYSFLEKKEHQFHLFTYHNKEKIQHFYR